MESGNNEREGFLGGMARFLNTGGATTVKAYDTTSEGVARLVAALQKIPSFTEESWEALARKMGPVSSGKTSRLEKLIREHERQIKIRYFQIGKKSSEAMESGKPEDSEAVEKLLFNVKEHEREIRKLKAAITRIEEEEAAEKLRKKERKREGKLFKSWKKKEKGRSEEVDAFVEASLGQAVAGGGFESQPAQECFYQVACGLLDPEIEIKCLAAAELGKMGLAHAVPVLIDAAGYDDPDLAAEIVNALIALGDERALDLFSRGMDSPRHRVRISCLSGMVTMGEKGTIVPLLARSLADEHPAVRRAALTLIGWKRYEGTLSAVLPCLQDPAARVRETAVAALASLQAGPAVPLLIDMLMDREMDIRKQALAAIQHITGQTIAFDVTAKGEPLRVSIRSLKETLGDLEEKGSEAAARPEPGEKAGEAEEEVAHHRESSADEEPEPSFTESRLRKMNKAELVRICEQLGIESGELPKSELVRLILAAG